MLLPTFRLVISASQLLISDYEVPITMQSRLDEHRIVIENVFIGHAASGGNPWDFDGDQVRVTWNRGRGNSRFNIPINDSKIFDSVSFSVNASKDLIIAWDSTEQGFKAEDGVTRIQKYSMTDSQAAGEDAPSGLSPRPPGFLMAVSDITLATSFVSSTLLSQGVRTGDSPTARPQCVLLMARHRGLQ